MTRRPKASTWCSVMLLFLLIAGTACQSGDGGLQQAVRLEHLAVLEQETRLNEQPSGGRVVASNKRVTCEDMSTSDRTLATSRNYEFSGPRAEVIEFHGMHLQQSGWTLSQEPDLSMDFTTAVYDKSFNGWQGRVVIVFNGQRIGLLAEDISSKVC